MERIYGDDDFVKFKNLCGIPESVNSREEIEKIMMSRVRDRRLRRLRQRQRNQTKGKKRYSEQELQKKKSKTSKTSKKENSQESQVDPDLLKIMATSQANFQRIFNPKRGKKRYSEQELQELQKKKSKTSKKENSQESQVDPDLLKIMATSEANFQRIFNPRRGKNFLFRIMFWDMCLLSSIIV